MRKSFAFTLGLPAMVFAACLFVDLEPTDTRLEIALVSEAQALIGRPRTPGSFAGVGRRTTHRVARRTTRRTVRRTSIYAASLPSATCAPVEINTATYQKCGSTYYEEVNGQYVVVQVQ